MCGRFVLYTVGSELADFFGLEKEVDFAPRYNIAPTEMVVILRLSPRTFQKEFAAVKWGLIPAWSKDQSIGAKLINARAETIGTKPAFRAAFKFRRCLIPADGFYQWKSVEGKKVPYFFKMADGSLFAFAGLWEQWRSLNGEMIESCTILTTDTNELMRPIHDRMPVILSPEEYEIWLDPNRKPPELFSLIRPYESEKMIFYRVSQKVNRAGKEDKTYINPSE